MSQMEEGMFRDRRVSDWSQSQISEPTGREIVHLYLVRTPDGRETLMGVGAAKKAMGFNESRLYSIAKREAQAQRERAAQWDRAEARMAAAAPTTREGADAGYRKANDPQKMMWGTQEQHAAKADELFQSSIILEKAGRFVRTGDTNTIENLRARGWSPVPPEVLAEYPDLAPKPEAITTPKEPTRGKVQEEEGQPQGLLKNPPSTPPPVESRSAGAPISRDERITSARKAMTAADREAMGLGAMDNPGRRGWEEALDTAREKGFNKKETALALAEDVNARPRAFDDVETAGLVEAANDLKKRHAELMQGVDKLTDRAEIFVRAAEIDRVETDFDNLTQALRKSGTEKGRALAAQKLTLNADNQLVSVLNRAKVKKGAELSPAERAKFEDLTKRLEERSARVTELEKQIAETQAEQAVKRHAGRKRAMAPKAREAEYASLLDKAKKLIAEGCD